MSGASLPAWLQELQASFGEMLRSPLDRSTGTLRADPSTYPVALLRQALPALDLSAGERLAIYNRQYWFRLFTVLQRAFPLTARLAGFWRFNEYAANFLLAHPPRGWDLDCVGAGFPEFLCEAWSGERARHEEKLTPHEQSGEHADPEALIEAARIDRAYHDVFRAPPVARYEPSANDAGRLPHARLQLSPAVALLSEHWPLAEMRQSALATPGDAAIRLEARLSEARHFLLARDGLQLALLPLEPGERKLLGLLSRGTVGAALAELELTCSETERGELPINTRKWLASSVRLGVWAGANFAQ
jgi:hypothetical protein